MDALWALPLATIHLRLVFQRRLEMGTRGGARPETSLRGLLFSALLDAGCRRGGRCRQVEAGHPCRERAACAFGTLYQPRCEHQRRDHPSPVSLYLNVLDDSRVWQVTMLLWGRRALAHRALLVAAMEAAGNTGVRDLEGRVAFRVEARPGRTGSLADYCQRRAPQVARLDFVSPCQSRAHSLQALLGNTAHDLMQWALADSGASAALGKRGCDAIADAARDGAVASLDRVSEHWTRRRGLSLGKRVSRTNRGQFSLEGFTGTVWLSGDLDAGWPWLRALALHGAGARRGFGMGRVRLAALAVDDLRG